jgi:hypothetical protein
MGKIATGFVSASPLAITDDRQSLFQWMSMTLKRFFRPNQAPETSIRRYGHEARYEAARFPKRTDIDGFFTATRLQRARPQLDSPPFVSVEGLTPGSMYDPEPAFCLGFDAAFPEQPVTLYVAVARAFAGRVS